MPTYAKALIGALSAFFAQLQLIFVSDDLTFEDVSQAQWVLLISVSFNAGVAVFAIKNGTSPNPDTSTPEPAVGTPPPPQHGDWVTLPGGTRAQVVYETAEDDPHHPMH